MNDKLKFYKWSKVDTNLKINPSDRPIEMNIDEFMDDIRLDPPYIDTPCYIINRSINGKTADDFLCPSMVFIDIDFHNDDESEKDKLIQQFLDDTNTKSLQDFVDKISANKKCIAGGLSRSGKGIRLFFNVITRHFEFETEEGYSTELNKAIHKSNWNKVIDYLNLNYDVDPCAKYVAEDTSANKITQVTYRFRKTGSFYNKDFENLENNSRIEINEYKQKTHIDEAGFEVVDNIIEKVEISFFDELYKNNEDKFKIIFNHYNTFYPILLILKSQPENIRMWFYNLICKLYRNGGGFQKHLKSFDNFNNVINNQNGKDQLTFQQFFNMREIYYMDDFNFDGQPIEENIEIETKTTEVEGYDYKNHTREEIKKFHKVLATAPIKGTFDYLCQEYDNNKNYIAKPYLLYPLIKLHQLGHCFGETGEGKSVFGMEIANIIARGYTDWEIFRCDCPPQNVLYIDFELGNSSLAGRYTKDKFHKNLHIITINNNEYNNYVGWDNKQSERLDRAISFIEEAALRFDSKVIFIDNFSNIADQTEQAAEADRFISELYGRMKALDLTIMFLGHTPKKQKDVAITINHMKGSSSLAKTYESIISFKRSLIDDNVSYIKQLKHRDLDLIFTDDNVGVFNFDKNGDHGYEMNFTGFDDEENLLKKKNLENNFTGKYDDDLIVKALYDKKVIKLTWEEISVKYKIPIRTAEGFINKLKNRMDLTEKFEDYKKSVSNDKLTKTSGKTSDDNIEDDTVINFKIKKIRE